MLPRLCWVALCWGRGGGGGSLPFYTNDIVSWKLSECSSLRSYSMFHHCYFYPLQGYRVLQRPDSSRPRKLRTSWTHNTARVCLCFGLSSLFLGRHCSIVGGSIDPPPPNPPWLRACLTNVVFTYLCNTVLDCY